MLSSEQISFLQEAGVAALGKGWIILPSTTRHFLPWQLPAPLNSPYEHNDDFRQSLGQRAAGPGGGSTSEHTRALHLGLVTDMLLCVQGPG